MDKMKFESPDITAQNIDCIASLFPACVTEVRGQDGKLKRAVNFKLLQQMLSDVVLEGDEAYEFTWVGKKAAIVEANRPIRKTLCPCPEESVEWDSTENLYIEGDNLEVLKLLQENYLGKIKIIYIDPPYNTGNDFIYRDEFDMSDEEFSEGIGQIDEETRDRLFRNTDSNGRFHSDWCSMIYSRMMLARNLLADDGVIFISIDDNEVSNLIKICDEIFGKSNFITDIIWEKRYTRNNDAKLMSTVVDHVLCYRKSEVRYILREPRTDKQNSTYSNPDNDPRGVWTSVLFTSQRTKEERPNLSYAIMNPITRQMVEHPTNAWKYSRKEYERLEKDGRLYWGKEGKNSYPRIKRFLSELDDGVVPINLWYYKETATLDEGTKMVDALLGKGVFDYPKPIQIIQRMLNMIGEKDLIALDFFSGSATTAHAVMQLNAEDGGHRKFIMVQLPEPCDEKSEAYKAGYTNICDIGKERIRRAAKKIAADNPDKPFDGGFRVFKLDESNMTDVYYSAGEYDQAMLSRLESNIKPDRTDLDLLFGCLLDWGLPLSMPYTSEKIEGCTVHTYAPGDASSEIQDGLIACFDENIPDNVIKEIARRQPLRAVFRDSSFADSPAKINVGEIFKMLAPDTRVKVL